MQGASSGFRQKEKHVAYLASPTRTMAVLERHGLRAQKKYGQNFLIDGHVLDHICDGAQIGKNDLVLEIGPGIGTMTQYLAERAGKVIAVEIDDKLIPVLSDTLSEYDNVTVLHQDILKTDIRAQYEKEGVALHFKVVANLPYYITTPIIMELLEQKLPIESITVMVQTEVAERMQAVPGTKDYGALSLAVQYYTKPEVIAEVPPTCFIPRPNVGSSVIRLTRYTDPPVVAKDEKKMFAVIRASFNQRRKTLINGLAGGGVAEKESVRQALLQMGLPEDIRGERLSVEQFARLAELI
ncbi:MAG: 16S rRNA (adenine(1518)-N(6)/adenine(1519)-N(6))-dimethyltransferase RsmA [Lachnospiraceae bacterium]|nr:16S rRNA (adenine(1518)-N(6)/adenine(1519)-N(6))-dimethyltransferase RsmA [Lachnospiraceae bacterium]